MILCHLVLQWIFCSDFLLRRTNTFILTTVAFIIILNFSIININLDVHLFGWSFEMKVKLNESLFTTGHDGGEIEMMYSESLSSDITHWSSLPVQF